MTGVDALRARRRELQSLDDAVSYVRRVAQGRADLARAELARRQAGDDGPPPDRNGEVRDVLADRLIAPGDRPPRPVEDFSDDPRTAQLDRLCAEHGFGRLLDLDADALVALTQALDEFEATVSAERQDVFVQLDAVTDELVTAYRDQVASGRDEL